MANESSTAAAVAVGQKKADEILAERRIARRRRAEALAAHPRKLDLTLQVASEVGPVAVVSLETAGFLVAAGDSWFDYPFHDILKLLEDDYGYNVESAAHRGDPIESMAYEGGQLDKLARCLEKVVAHGATPKAVLLSAGGDDIAGEEFGMLLNNSTSAISGWNREIVDGLLNVRILSAYKTMVSFVTSLCEKDLGERLPIFVHGYDYPVPDGRGFLGGWLFPGPWLEPGFREKLFTDPVTKIALMRDIIDRFNDMLTKLANDPAFDNVHYIDLRGTLSTDLTNDTYHAWWANELHPTKDGFAAVTARFAAALSKF
jgi:hypothetical protein